jgi:two-component system phosphate regulon sensor histidine kinase PhoR
MPAVPAASLRQVLAASLLAAPAAAAFVLLAVLGAVGPFAAAAGVAASAALLAAALRLLRGELHAVAAYLARLAGLAPGEEPPAPDGPSAAARSLNAAALGILRAARAREEGLARELEAREQILDALHDPFVLLDEGRRVLRANQAAAAVLGDRLEGRDLAASLRNPHLLEAVDAVLGGSASRRLEFTLPVPVERVFEARVQPFRHGRGEGGRVILTLHDITAIKRSERMRADFVANASHELRTPLASLVGFIETLRGPARDDAEAQERFLAIMHDQSLRMSRLVNDLLSLSRIELDEHTPPTGTADVAALVGNVVATLELRAASRRVAIRLDLPEDPPQAVGDEDQLSQVFQNLIDNAIKYGREGTEVAVRVFSVEPGGLGGSGAPIPTLSGPFPSGPARPGQPPAAAGRGGPMVAVAVTDRGEGIPRTHLPRLTERFYRADPARSKALGGTGLGLAIVKHIVNRHRGRLTIESEIGRGSTFTVYLPAAYLPAAAETGLAPRLESGSAAE